MTITSVKQSGISFEIPNNELPLERIYFKGVHIASVEFGKRISKLEAYNTLSTYQKRIVNFAISKCLN